MMINRNESSCWVSYCVKRSDRIVKRRLNYIFDSLTIISV